MSKGDFFSFVTSLKPIEMKAIGELSQVVHLDEGVTVYNSGDDSDTLYIINRGTVEVIHESPATPRTPRSPTSAAGICSARRRVDGHPSQKCDSHL